MTTSVLFVFRRKRAERLQLNQAGLGPDEMLYGLTHFNTEQFTTAFIEDDQKMGGIKKIWSPIERRLSAKVKMGFNLDLALVNLKQLQHADIIISTVDSWGLPLAMLKYVGILKTPVIYISQGLSDRVEALPRHSYLRAIIYKLYTRFLNKVEAIVTLGAGASQHFLQIFPQVSTPVTYLPFGIDANFWHPAFETPDDYILSVGSDQSRDYETLLEAVGADCHLKIVTRLPLAAAKAGHNVAISSDYSDVELRTLYQQAKFVITPLKDVAQPSGQSATLQAMACGKAVILTNTQGLWEPAVMRHLENCYLVKPADAGDLKQAINYLLNNPTEATRLGQNARHSVETHYNSRHFAAKLQGYVEKICQTL